MSIEEKLYSEAFESGVDYAIEKMFGDKLPPANSPVAIGPAGDPGLRGNYEKSLWDKIKGLPKSIKDRYMKAGKLGKAGMIAAAAVPVVAAASYGIHKATKKDKTYSEGFDDGVDYAIQRMFATVTNYDRYNTLRDMNDADVLAQEKKKNPYSAGRAVGTTLAGAAVGAGLGATVGTGVNMFRKGASVGRGAGKGAILGGAVGAVGAGLAALHKRNKGKEEVSEYNRRLGDAQRLAARRERVDWYKNQRGRTDYTY